MDGVNNFTVTKDWIMSHQTSKGSWNAKQLKCLGLDWPASKGWINRAVGYVITTDMQQKFEILAGEPAKDKINVQQQELRIIQLERHVAYLMDFVGAPLI